MGFSKHGSFHIHTYRTTTGALHDKETTVEDVELLWANVEKVGLE